GMSLASRLKRLETAMSGSGEPGRRTFEDFLADHARLFTWLKERGYPDHLAALEAGETGPEGLQDLLREQAAYDPKRRAWARIEPAWDRGELGDEVDYAWLEPFLSNNGKPPEAFGNGHVWQRHVE